MSVRLIRFCLLLLAALSGALRVTARDDMSAAGRLEAMGFENVRVAVADGAVFAAIEDRTCRGTYRGLGAALRMLAECIPGAGRFEVVLLDAGIPQVCAHAGLAEGSWTVDVDYDVARVMAAVKGAEKHGSQAGRIDITLYPKVSIDNHRLDVLCEYALAIAPSIETTLWPGSRITIQPVLPFAGGNLDRSNTLRHCRIGIADIEQELLRGGRRSLKVAAGMMYPDLAGVHAEAGVRLSDAIGLKVQAGCLGDAYADDRGYHFGSIDRLTFLVKGDWYERLSRLQVQLTAGRFVYGDYGGRIDVTRHLGDYAIGIYGILSEGEHNAGFHFAIPMGGRRQRRSGRVRLRLPEYFNWEYSMVSYYEFADRKMGREYHVRADDNRSARYFQADYIQQNLQRYLDGTAE